MYLLHTLVRHVLEVGELLKDSLVGGDVIVPRVSLLHHPEHGLEEATVAAIGGEARALQEKTPPEENPETSSGALGQPPGGKAVKVGGLKGSIGRLKGLKPAAAGKSTSSKKKTTKKKNPD